MNSNRAAARRLLAAAVVAALGVDAANAATITVTTGDDAGDATSCTLRQAILAANSDTVQGTCSPGSGDDTIAFAPALAAATIKMAPGVSA